MWKRTVPKNQSLLREFTNELDLYASNDMTDIREVSLYVFSFYGVLREKNSFFAESIDSVNV